MSTAIAIRLLAYPFRIFFVLTGLYGALVLLPWPMFLLLDWPLPGGALALHWHAHELLFGMVPAAIAGFLLTAMANWTGTRPPQGATLGLLVLLWLAGRLAFWGSALLPPLLVLVLDMPFLLALALYAGTVLLRAGNKRNYPLVLVLLMLASANLLLHLQFIGLTQSAALGELLAITLLTLLMVIIAGRITPNFSANWLRQRGANPAQIRQWPTLDLLAISSIVLMLVVDLLLPVASAAAALLAAASNGARLLGWRGWQVRSEPLLWILHLGYAWIVLGLLLKALTPLTGLNPFLWMHAIGAGAAGTLILGVMTRVAMGHTGRPLQLVRGGQWIYYSVLAAATLRLATALNWLPYGAGLTLSALFWSLAFGLFLVRYFFILSQPRADGRPG